MENSAKRLKPLIGFWAGDQNNFQFLDPIIEELGKEFGVQKFFYQEGEHQKFVNQINSCDLAWFEWANGPVIPATHLETVRTPFICRLHRYEAYSNAPTRINWQKINTLIFIAESVRESFRGRFPGIIDQVHNLVIRNGVNTEKFETDITRSRGKKVAYLGRLHYHKNPSLLLQCFYALVKEDPQYELHVAGRFCDSVIEEYFWDQVSKLELGKKVIYYGEITEVNKWLNDMDFLLLPSIIEGQSVAALEAMALGIKPIIFNYFMADSLFPKKYLFNTVEECVQKILSNDFDRQEYRDYVRINNDLNRQMAKIKEVIAGALGS